jgi:hypothetical protein
MTTELSQIEAILLAASRLSNYDGSPFSAEQIVVAAWLECPRQFGLKGYSDEYPDAHKVVAVLCGAKGLVGRGYLSRNDGLYMLTAAGRRLAMKLSGEPTPPVKGGEKPVYLPAAQDDFLKRRLSAAKHPLKDWTFADAAIWWQLVDDNNNGERVALVSDQLAEISTILAGRRCVLSDGHEVGAEEVAELIELDAALRQRFASHLKLLANRNGKPKEQP